MRGAAWTSHLTDTRQKERKQFVWSDFKHNLQIVSHLLGLAGRISAALSFFSFLLDFCVVSEATVAVAAHVDTALMLLFILNKSLLTLQSCTFCYSKEFVCCVKKNKAQLEMVSNAAT